LKVERLICPLLMVFLVISLASGQLDDSNASLSTLPFLSESDSEEEPQGLLPQVNKSEEKVVPETVSEEESQGLLPDVTIQLYEEWCDWKRLNGLKITTSPAVVSPWPGMIDVFVGGEENELWQLHYDGSWTNKKLFGPPPPNQEKGVDFRKYQLAAVYTGSSPQNGHYHLFTWGPTNNCLYKRFSVSKDGVNSDQNEWTKIEGDIYSKPAATISSERIYIFALNESGSLIYTSASIASGDEEMTWNKWTSINGNFTNSPAVTSTDDETIHIFATTKDDELVHIKRFRDKATKPTDPIAAIHTIRMTRSIVGPGFYAPSAISSDLDKIDLFAIGLNNTLMHRQYDGADWKEWEDLDGNIISQPAAIWDGTGQIYVFAQDGGDRLSYIRYGPQEKTVYEMSSPAPSNGIDG
jgi:hypothetical protein